MNQYLKQWMRIVSQHIPDLSIPQIRGLATWSFGMVITRSSSLSKVATFIACLNGEKVNTVRCRLKEWYQESAAKTGNKRAQLEVQKCFAPLLKWVWSLLPADLRCLPLALDATSVGQNFTVLTINVLYRGCAIPVAWKVVKALKKGSWKPYWQDLLAALRDVIPAEVIVIVCADRGLYADWLFEHIKGLGWHPILRINHQGTYKPPHQSTWQPLTNIVTAPGQRWSGRVECFKTNPLNCTLLARWDEGYKDPWLIVTDLPDEAADILWYGLRAWIECSYRDIKSDGMQWHKTRLTDPSRAERHWLAMALATLWIVTTGGEIDAHPPENLFEQLPDNHVAKQRPPQLNRPRSMSCFLQGLLTLIADLLNGLPIHIRRLFPQLWPGCQPRPWPDTG